MRRFYVDPDALRESPLQLGGSVAHQLRRVLRLGPGDRVALFCGDGRELEARILRIDAEHATLEIEQRREPAVEPSCRIELGLALLKGEKCEWVIQKAVELGAAAITLLETRYCVPNVEDKARWKGRLERYAAIAREAVEQCGGVRLPPIDGPEPFGAFLERRGDGLTYLADLSAEQTLSELLSARPARVRLLIGPEGGFSREEREQALAAGAVACRLGRRVLRSETAAVTAVALAAALAD